VAEAAAHEVEERRPGSDGAARERCCYVWLCSLPSPCASIPCSLNTSCRPHLHAPARSSFAACSEGRNLQLLSRIDLHFTIYIFWKGYTRPATRHREQQQPCTCLKLLRKWPGVRTESAPSHSP
jgi:hypothetical protein